MYAKMPNALRKQERKAEYNLAVGGKRPDSLIAKEYWSIEENRKALSDKMKLRWKKKLINNNILLLASGGIL